MERQLYKVSSFYNDYEDQGMHACQCGVTLEKGDLAEMMDDVVTQILVFSKDFPVNEGTMEFTFGDREENKDMLFITWKHDEDDRCFGIEVQPL